MEEQEEPVVAGKALSSQSLSLSLLRTAAMTHTHGWRRRKPAVGPAVRPKSDVSRARKNAVAPPPPMVEEWKKGEGAAPLAPPHIIILVQKKSSIYLGAILLDWTMVSLQFARWCHLFFVDAIIYFY